MVETRLVKLKSQLIIAIQLSDKKEIPIDLTLEQTKCVKRLKKGRNFLQKPEESKSSSCYFGTTRPTREREYVIQAFVGHRGREIL